MAVDSFIQAHALFKIYKANDLEVVALQGLDFQVERGSLVAIVGASGSGKSTLLNMLGGLDIPSAGVISVGGKNLGSLKESELVRYRREDVGFLWQQPGRNLLPYLSNRDNVELPLVLAGVSTKARHDTAMDLLTAVGMADKAEARPGVLSGGEQQRVATAVALALDPPLLLADEPTGELDTTTSQTILTLFRRLCKERNLTIVMVTHDPAAAAQADKIAHIRDGRVSTETVRDVETIEAPSDLVVVDASGRLQLPASLMQELGIRVRVRVTHEGDHIGVWKA